MEPDHDAIAHMVSVYLRVDRFRQFRTAVFVYGARINPRMVVPVVQSQFAGSLDLRETRQFASGLEILNGLPVHLAISPSVRQNRVRLLSLVPNLL